LSYAPGSAGGKVMVLNALVLTLAGFASAYWRSPLPLAAGVAVAIALWLFRLHMQQLFCLSPAQVAQARKAEGFGLVFLVLFSVMQ
jgi:CBS-domain-containing membrane protein